MAGGFIDATMNTLNTGGQGYVEAAFNAFSPVVITSFKILASISVAWYGIRAMLGMGDLSLGSIFRQLMPIVVVIAVLSNWDLFQTFFFDIVVKLPDEVGKTLFSAFGGGGSASDATTALQSAWDIGWDAVKAVFAKGGVTSMGAFLLAIVIAVGIILFVVGGFVIVLMAKMFAFVMLAVAPLFFMLACFQWTRQFVSSYLNALFNVIVALIVAYAVVGFFLGLSEPAMQSLKAAAGGTEIDMGQIGPFMFFAFLGFFVFLQTPQIAAQLAGGVALDMGRELTRFARGRLGDAASAAGGGYNRMRGGSRRERVAATRAEALEQRREAHGSANAQMIANAVMASRKA